MLPGSKETAKAAVRLALSSSREEEKMLKERYADKGIMVAAVDFGGEFVPSTMRIVECTVVAAKRENIIGETHHEEGCCRRRNTRSNFPDTIQSYRAKRRWKDRYSKIW